MTCLGHAELIAEAMKQPAFQSIIYPDDACFANPSSMVEAIKQYCEKTGQHVTSELWRILPLHLRESRTPLSSDFHLAEGFCRLRPQRAPHHRWWFAQSISQPVYSRQLRCHRSGWSSGRYSHRQHHASGKGIRLGQGHLGNASDHRQLAGAQEIRATRQRGMGCGLRKVF